MNMISGCRKKLPLLVLALGFTIPVAPAQAADTFPSRTIRLITPANPGGTTDFLARLLAPHLTKVWGEQAIVDNRGSASGVNAAEITKNADPDGYTLRNNGSEAKSSTPEEFRQFMLADMKKWADVVNRAGIKAQ